MNLSALVDFQPLKYLPVGMNVILWLISTKTVEMEDVRVLRASVFEDTKSP
jgi:hypothetical protein